MSRTPINPALVHTPSTRLGAAASVSSLTVLLEPIVAPHVDAALRAELSVQAPFLTKQ